MKALLIVDPQIDFINGSLPVPDAAAAMDSLAEYVSANASAYSNIMITTDFHPEDHCSFVGNGGTWPAHCVQGSEGVSVWPGLFSAIMASGVDYEILRKGDKSDSEEYSIFKNDFSAGRISELLGKYGVDKVDLCGIAGDICVLNTLRDGVGIYGKDFFNVLKEYSPSLDGGKALDEFVSSLLAD